ncbi:unnamed protein product [Rotaria sp. Silwood2]|nr:unnamed protein product [Rotaria sp. Silwood2]CAF3072386.1 unnamed protein product [Rotaria sp. Silwood2]CAF3312670.1 unnamed protein product [Rotaria sp. Silwood2]CAF4478952.1 unnamed protein product [Rotaria sp. Silwood2]CAF4523570.1 unnamed protein product [Rotaria sp. Silwood2]
MSSYESSDDATKERNIYGGQGIMMDNTRTNVRSGSDSGTHNGSTGISEIYENNKDHSVSSSGMGDSTDYDSYNIPQQKSIGQNFI